MSDLRFALEEAFRRENIEIPFPQQDLHIRSVDGEVMGNMGQGASTVATEAQTEEKLQEEPVQKEQEKAPGRKAGKKASRKKRKGE